MQISVKKINDNENITSKEILFDHFFNFKIMLVEINVKFRLHFLYLYVQRKDYIMNCRKEKGKIVLLHLVSHLTQHILYFYQTFYILNKKKIM